VTHKQAQILQKPLDVYVDRDVDVDTNVYMQMQILRL